MLGQVLGLWPLVNFWSARRRMSWAVRYRSYCCPVHCSSPTLLPCHYSLAIFAPIVATQGTQDCVDELSLCHPPHDSIFALSIASEVRSQGFETVTTIQKQPRADPSPALTAFHILQASPSATHRVRTRLDIWLKISECQQDIPGLHTIAALHRRLRERPEPQASTSIESPSKPPVRPRTGHLLKLSIVRSIRPVEAAVSAHTSPVAIPSEIVEIVSLSRNRATVHWIQQKTTTSGWVE